MTNSDDRTADRVDQWLAAKGDDHLRFDTDRYPVEIDLEWTVEGATLFVPGRAVSSTEVNAVWWRRPMAGRLGRIKSREAVWATNEAQAALEGFWRSLDAHWVNHPDCNAVAESKPLQLQRAAAHGFEVPRTLITNSSSKARAFARDHGPVICKSIDDPRVPTGKGLALFHTEIVDPDLLAHDVLDVEPYLFQELIEKAYDVRVTVIGEAVVATRIDSQSASVGRVDWRKAPLDELPHSPEALPAGVERACLALARSFGLRYAAIDLARRGAGGYVFFELNPNGQWAWLEDLTDQPLTRLLCDELTGGSNGDA